MSSPRLILSGSDAIRWKAYATARHHLLESVRRFQHAPVKHQFLSVEGATILLCASENPAAHRIIITAGAATLHDFRDPRAAFDWFWDYNGGYYTDTIKGITPYGRVGDSIWNGVDTFPTNQKQVPAITADGKAIGAWWYTQWYGYSNQNISHAVTRDGQYINPYPPELIYNEESSSAHKPWAVTIFDVPRFDSYGDPYEWNDLIYNRYGSRPIKILGNAMTSDGLLRCYYYEQLSQPKIHLIGFSTESGEVVQSQYLPDWAMTVSGMGISRMYQLRHQSHGDVMYTLYGDSGDVWLAEADVNNVQPEVGAIVTEGEVTGRRWLMDGILGSMTSSSLNRVNICVTAAYVYLLLFESPAVKLFRAPRYDFWRKTRPYAVGDTRRIQGTDGFFTLTCTTAGESGETLEVTLADVGVGVTDGTADWDVALATLDWEEVYLTDETNTHQPSVAVAVSPDDKLAYTGWQTGDFFGPSQMYKARGRFGVYDIEDFTNPVTEVHWDDTTFGTGQEGAGIIGLSYK